MDVTQDERYSVADEAIYDAFFELLKTKGIEKITVSDVIKKAGVVRSTFYNHYENIPALISAIEDKTIEDIFSLMESFRPQNDYDVCYSYFLVLCNYTQNNSFLSELLGSPRCDEFFEKSMTMFHRYVRQVMKEKIPVSHTKEEISYAVAAVIGATVGILHKWTREKCVVPAETIADTLAKIFITGIWPLLS